MNLSTFTRTVATSALLASTLTWSASANAQECPAVCPELKKTWEAACGSSLPDYGRSPERWFEQVSGFADAYAEIQEGASSAPACVACGGLWEGWERACASRKEQIASQWGDHMKWTGEASEQLQSYITFARERGMLDQAISRIDDELAVIDRTRELNAMPGLGHDTAAIDARSSALSAQRAELRAAREEQLAAVRCPRKGKKNARHFETVKAFFLEDPEHAKTLKSLRVTGRSGTRYERWKRTTFETLPLTTCVRDDTPATGPRCYVWEMSVQRSRVDGQKWSAWDTVLVGSQKEMLCANLK
jgi:hypothetical protein